MIRYSKFFVIVVTLFLVPLFIPNGLQAKTLKLKLSSESTPTAPTTYMNAAFKDALIEELGNQVEIEYFHSGALGDEIVHMEQVRTGQIDVVPIGSDAVQLDPKWAIFDMPFLFPDRETAAKVLDGRVGKLLAKSMRAKAGIEVLALGEVGFRNITNNVRPVVKPSDLKGLKLRTPGSKTRILAFKMLGAAPINMNIAELYLALQQGVMDGQENPLSVIYGRSFYEVQKYISLSRHVYTPVTLSMNGRKYDSLTSEQKKAVHRAAIKAVQASRRYSAEADAKLVAKIKEKSKGKTQFNDINVAAFQEASKPIWKEIAKVSGEEFTDIVLQECGHK